MDTFARRQFESLAEQFTAGAERFALLQHVVMMGPCELLGVGGDVTKFGKRSTHNDAQFFALNLIGEGLAKSGMLGETVHSHDLVVIPGAIPPAPLPCQFGRSVIYGGVADSTVAGFVRYCQLAREAYRLVHSLEHSRLSPWKDLSNHPEHGVSDAHYWSVGLARWVEGCHPPTVSVREGIVKLIGGPICIAKDDGTSHPLMVRPIGEPARQLMQPYSVEFGAGLRSANLPTEEKAREMVLQMCEGGRTLAIQHGLFTASATAIHWMLSLQDDQPCRLHIDEIDSFSKVRDVSPESVAHLLDDGCVDVFEDDVRKAVEQILNVPFNRKDSPAELDDVYTSNTLVNGVRRATAIMLKGRKGVKVKVLEIKHCGSKGDQLVKLFDAPADLFIVQFNGRISESVIKDVESKTTVLRTRGKPAQYVIVDGQDTARLLQAYGLVQRT